MATGGCIMHYEIQIVVCQIAIIVHSEKIMSKERKRERDRETNNYRINIVQLVLATYFNYLHSRPQK